VPSRPTEDNLETGHGAVAHQVRLPVGGAERGLDVERGRVGVGLQHLCDNGGDGADIAGAVGKQDGVTVLQGKRHEREVNALLHHEVNASVAFFADRRATRSIGTRPGGPRPYRDPI
jgi:hypothetical protein